MFSKGDFHEGKGHCGTIGKQNKGRIVNQKTEKFPPSKRGDSQHGRHEDEYLKRGGGIPSEIDEFRHRGGCGEEKEGKERVKGLGKDNMYLRFRTGEPPHKDKKIRP